jgi:hypothetical protein
MLLDRLFYHNLCVGARRVIRDWEDNVWVQPLLGHLEPLLSQIYFAAKVLLFSGRLSILLDLVCLIAMLVENLPYHS